MSPEDRESPVQPGNVIQRNGKLDSACFLAPMAIQPYKMIGPLDAHARYDISSRLKECDEHSRDIDDALKKVAAP
jgi:hypothetical protein